MNKKNIITFLFALIAMSGQGQEISKAEATATTRNLTRTSSRVPHSIIAPAYTSLASR